MADLSAALFLFLAAAGAVPLAQDQSCMRLVALEEPDRPSPDGPGAFGPLHETLTLGCLRVISIAEAAGNRVAKLRDERARIYEVSVGDWIGENAGRISEVTAERITVRQVVVGPDGEFVETSRFLFVRPPHES